MPKIRVEQTGISTDVQGADLNTGAQGIVGQAAAGMGAIAEQTSYAVGEKLLKAEAQDSVETALHKDKIDSLDYYEKLRLSSPDGYVRDADGSIKKNSDETYRTITQEYRSWANDRFESTQTQLPSRMAQDLYKTHGGNFYVEQMGKMKLDELTLRADSFTKKTAARLDEKGNVLFNDPFSNKLYEFRDDEQRAITAQAPIVGAALAEKMKMEVDQNLAKQYVNGGIAKILTGTVKKSGDRVQAARELIDYIEGKATVENQWVSYFNEQDRKNNKLPTLTQMLSPEEKASAVNRLVGMFDFNKKSNRNDWDSEVANLIGMEKSGAARDLGPTISKGLTLVNNGSIDASHMLNQTAEMIAAQEIRKVINPFKNGATPFYIRPKAEQEAVMKNVMDRVTAVTNRLGDQVFSKMQVEGVGVEYRRDVIGGVAREKAKELFTEAINAADSKKKADPQEFFRQNDASGTIDTALRSFDPTNLGSIRGRGGALKKMFNISAQYHDQAVKTGDRVPYNFLPDAEAELFAKGLKDGMISAETLAKNVLLAKQELNDPAHKRNYFPMMLNDVIDRGKLPPEYRFIGMMKSESDTIDVINMIQQPPEKTQELLNARSLKDPVSYEKDLVPAVAKQIDPFVLSAFQTDPRSPRGKQDALAYTRVVATKAANLMLDNTQLSTDEAAKAAAQALFHKYNVVVTSGGGWFGGKQSTSTIPRQIGDHTVTPEDEAMLSRWQTQTKTPEKLQTYGFFIPTKAGGAPSDIPPEVFYKRLADTGRWVPYQNKKTGEQGFALQYEINEGGSTTRMDYALKDMGKGHPPKILVFPYDKALTQQSIKEKENPGVGTKVFNMIRGVMQATPADYTSGK